MHFSTTRVGSLDRGANDAHRMRILILVALAVVALMVAGRPAGAVLTHRYSFSGNANDSVGTANWTVNGGASFSAGQVVLDGVDDYLSRAATPLPLSGSMTIE